MNHQRKDCMGEAADALTQMPVLTTGWELCKYFCFIQKSLHLLYYSLIHKEIKFLTRKNQLFLFHVFHLHCLCLGNREVEKRRNETDPELPPLPSLQTSQNTVIALRGLEPFSPFSDLDIDVRTVNAGDHDINLNILKYKK